MLDTVARKIASTMVGKFGQSVTMRQRVTGAFNTTTLVPSVSETDYTVSAIIGDYAQEEIKGLVKSGDKKVLVAAKDLTPVPTVEWEVKIGATWYTIRHVITSYSGDEAAMYEITARGP